MIEPNTSREWGFQFLNWIDELRRNQTFDQLNIRDPNVPSSASDTGTAGDIAWDSNYIYICTATDTWKRVAIATW